MRKALIAGLFLSLASLSYSLEREAFIFSSMTEDNSRLIDKNSTWRNTARTYQSLRDLGFSQDHIYVFYNDRKPDLKDYDIPLKKELDAHPLYEGKYSDLEKLFKERTNRLNKDDEVVLTTLTHGGDDGKLYPDYGKSISSSELSKLVDSTKARTLIYYFACNSSSMLEGIDANNSVFISNTPNKKLGWLDRLYCGAPDFFSAFTNKDADKNKDGKVSLEEAALYAKQKWNKYKDAMFNYWLKIYWIKDKWFNTKEDLDKKLTTDPMIKRGIYLPDGWTLEKR